MPKPSLKDFLRDQLAAKELTFERVISLSGVPEEYVRDMLEGKTAKLPPLPYMRAHLSRLAEVLEVTKEDLVEMYKEEFSEKLSGSADLLPSNRFALPSFKRRWVVVLLSTFVVVGLVTIGGRVLGEPWLTLTIPDPNENPYIVGAPTIMLTGHVQPGDKLMINNQAVPVDGAGSFIKEYRLDPELNTLEFIVTRFLGKELRVIKQVYYKIQ